MNAKWIGLTGTLAAAVVGFTGGFLGQHYSAERTALLERYRTVAALRSDTYVEFFTAQGQLQQARQFGLHSYGQWLDARNEAADSPDPVLEMLGPLLWQSELKTKEARMKLAAFAPTQMVEALSDYYVAQYGASRCDATWEDDAKVYASLRNDLLDGLEADSVDLRKLYFLMWNCTPADVE